MAVISPHRGNTVYSSIQVWVYTKRLPIYRWPTLGGESHIVLVIQMALTIQKVKSAKSQTISRASSNTGAALRKAAIRDELAVSLSEFLKEQLRVGYENELVLIDMQELSSILGQLPASVKNTIRGFAAKVGARGAVTVEYKRGSDAEAFYEAVNQWVNGNPEHNLRAIGGLALVRTINVNGEVYKIDNQEMRKEKFTIPRKGKKALSEDRWYFLKISNYWQGANSSLASE